MQDTTRQKLLAAAKKQFAEKGFYGASIAQVAGEVGLTKQALLYHFKRKEDLYAEVLEEISQRLLRLVRATVSSSDEPERQFEDIFLGLYAFSREYPLDTHILVRELLDNKSRLETVKELYLLPFLTEIVAVVPRMNGFEQVQPPAAFCMVYQIIGGIEYFVISTPSLKRMYGAETYESYRDNFPIELRNQIRRLIESYQA
ncbi:MAG: TetR/AcrR family transcriptional regulator [Woeseiaceae bacterium]|nr:TetR/AcrR family transcriptional regulator [Woeseiaceae bacterium]